MKQARLFITPQQGPATKLIPLFYDDWSTDTDGGEKSSGYFIGPLASATFDRLSYWTPDGAAKQTTHTETVLNGQEYVVKFRLSSMFSGSTLSSGVRVRAIIGGTATAWADYTGDHQFNVISAGTSIVFEVEGTATPGEYCGVTIDNIFLWEYDAADNELDIAEEGVEIQYAVDELTDPAKRASSYSLTFNLPNTARNNRVFGYAYELDSTGAFNPNKKLDAILEVNNIEVYKGILKLEAVSISNDGKITEYQATLNSPVFNVFSEWGDKELTDLDFSEFAHTIGQTALNISRGGDQYVGGVQVARGAGRGYAYVFADNGWVYWSGKTGVTPGTNMAVPISKVLPGIFLGEYLHKMFELIGCTFDSDFFTASPQTLIIIPPNSTEVLLDGAQVDARKYKAEISGATEFSITYDDAINEREQVTFAYYDDITGGTLFDNTGGYDITTYSWEVQKSGKYGFNADIELEPRYLSPNVLDDMYCVVDWFDCKLQLVTTRAGLEVVLAEGSPQDIARTTAAFTQSEWKSGAVTTLTMAATNIELLAGEVVSCKVRFKPRNAVPVVDGVNITEFFYRYLSPAPGFDIPVPVTGGDVRMRFNAGGQWYNDVVNEGISEGDLIDLNKVVPKGVKIADFFTSLVRMFNLFVVPDKDNPKKLYIEPRNDYETTSTVNWDLKLDLSKPLEVKPNGLVNAKKYIFKYSEDSDYFNSRYIANSYSPINQPFGTKTVEVDNDFLEGENVTGVIFAPTPVVKRVGGRTPLPSIITEDSKPFNGKIRIGYYQVIQPGSASTTDVYTINGDDTYDVWTTIPTYNALYPFYASAHSLEFGMSGTSFYWENGDNGVSLTYTNNNLFNKHWSKYIAEITDAYSKVVTAHFKLNEVDIYSLDFSKLYFVDNYYYRLLKVYYNPLSNDSTKVDLLKVKEAATFSAQNTLDFNGGDYGLDVTDSGVLGSDVLPSFGSTIGSGSEGSEYFGAAPSGNQDNNVNESATGVELINARNANVFEEATQILIANSDNVTISAGVTKATVIGSDGVTVTEDGETWINGVKIQAGFNDLTYTEALALISQASPAGDGLRVGEYYRITDRGDGDGYNDAGIVLQAVTQWEFGNQGFYIAYNPDYGNAGTYTNPITYGVQKGIWNANFAGINDGDVVIWDGKHYVNMTGNIGTEPSGDTTNYSELPRREENGYLKEVDICEYDFNSDDVIRRKDHRGNDIQGVQNVQQLFKWGSSSATNNTVINGYLDIRNFHGQCHDNFLHDASLVWEDQNGDTTAVFTGNMVKYQDIDLQNYPTGTNYTNKTCVSGMSNFNYTYNIDNDLVGSSLTWTAPEWAGVVTIETNGTLTTIELQRISSFNNFCPVEIRAENGLTLDFIMTPVDSVTEEGQMISDAGDFSLIGRTNVSDFVQFEAHVNPIDGARYVKKKTIGLWL